MQHFNILEQYKKLEKANESECYEFLCKLETSLKFSSSKEKEEFLTLLLKDLKTQAWSEKMKTQALSTIRILGRDPVGSDPLFTKEGLSLFVNIAFKPNQVIDTSSSREALKCIANCIQLNDKVKVYLEEKDVLGSCQYVLQSEDQISLDTQFLTCRILFFLTVNRPDLVTKLINKNISNGIEKVLTENISILEDRTNLIDRNMPINPYTVTSEALKLLFNLLLVESKKEENTSIDKFENCLIPVFHLLFKVPFAKPQPIIPPHSQAIYVLMQYPYSIIAKVWDSQSEWTRTLYDSAEQSHTFIATTLVNLLDQAVHTLIPDGDPDNVNDSSQVDAILSPVCLVLRSLAEGDPLLSRAIGNLLLPNEKDRLLPVHEGFGLPAYMIRLMTSTMMPLTRDAVCETLFILCDKDANKFIQQVGYGNAIGYLVNKGIAMDTPTVDENDDKNINPITGQYVSSEKQPDLKDMTDEEKEREAERLFVLFERLKKTGIIDVENPIAKAMQESQGRFEEIVSSDEE